MRLRKAPPGKKEKDPGWLIDNIAEASKNARRIYLLLMGFLAYCALTVASTKDRQLILNETAHLPIINLDVPLNSFFLLAPLIAVFVFMYLQLYVSSLKGLKNDLRTNYPPVEKRRLYPWMLNIAEDPEPGVIGRMQKIIVNFSLWWLLPIVLMLFPLGFLRKHDPLLSYVVGLIPVIGTAVVIWFWCLYEEVKLKRFILRNPGKSSLSIMLLLFGIFFNFFMIPWSFDGGKSGFLRPLLYVDLSYQKLVNEPNKDYKTFYWANLSGANLQGGDFSGSILKRADLEKANLKRAKFNNANLEGARLNYVQLQAADLRGTKLQGAFLGGAKLQGANLSFAQLQGAYLGGANLGGAKLQGADLWGAQLQGAKYLTIEQLSKVKTLYMAKLDSALMEEVKRKHPHLLEEPDLH